MFSGLWLWAWRWSTVLRYVGTALLWELTLSLGTWLQSCRVGSQPSSWHLGTVMFAGGDAGLGSPCPPRIQGTLCSSSPHHQEELMVAISFPCHKSVHAQENHLLFFPSHFLEGKRSDSTGFFSVLAAGLEGKGQNLHYWTVPFFKHEILKD